MSLPLRGEFLVVELDPLESLRPIIDDPEVLKACQALKLQTRKHVVCIIQRMGIAVVGALHPLEVAMVSRGFVPGPDEFVLSDMSIPVLPNTHHPRDRTPLVCDPPLPWDNCYIQTLALLPIRIKFSDPTPRARGKYWLNPPRQAGLIHFQCGDDNDWRDKLVRTAEMGGSDFEPDTYPGDEFDEPEGEPCYPWDNSEDTASLAVLESSKELAVDSKLNVTPSDIESVSDRASLHSAYAKSVVGFDEMVHQYDFTPVVNFSLDLEILSADEIPNPWEFFGEVDALEQIHNAHKARVQAKIDAAEKLNAEFDSKLAVAQEGSVVPESASTRNVGAVSGCLENGWNTSVLEESIDGKPSVVDNGSTPPSTLRADDALEDVKDARRQSWLATRTKRTVTAIKAFVAFPMKVIKCFSFGH